MKTERNSSIELLRLVAMLMIVARHYITLNPFMEQFSTQPLTFTTMFYEWIVSLGKIGVAVFFIISAWYLCEETHPTIRKGLKRAWILEREVLFYSLGLMLVFVVFQPDLISKKTIALSFIPTISGSYWWYVTAYALFFGPLPLPHCWPPSHRQTGPRCPMRPPPYNLGPYFRHASSEYVPTDRNKFH